MRSAGLWASRTTVRYMTARITGSSKSNLPCNPDRQLDSSRHRAAQVGQVSDDEHWPVLVEPQRLRDNHAYVTKRSLLQINGHHARKPTRSRVSPGMAPLTKFRPVKMIGTGS